MCVRHKYLHVDCTVMMPYICAKEVSCHIILFVKGRRQCYLVSFCKQCSILWIILLGLIRGHTTESHHVPKLDVQCTYFKSMSICWYVGYCYTLWCSCPPEKYCKKLMICGKCEFKDIFWRKSTSCSSICCGVVIQFKGIFGREKCKLK